MPPVRTAPNLKLLALALLASGCALGCRAAPAPGVSAGPVAPAVAAISNPLFISGADREVVYEQAVDVIDDYFKIQSERRLKLVGGIVTPGRIDTFPVIGSTLLEPWRADFALDNETTLNTLQTVRRYATVELLPSEGGYLISVNVMKEMEDLSQPENATVGRNTLRHDGSLVRTREAFTGDGPVTLGWIPLGRDISLEQRILAEIQTRLTAAVP